MLAGDFFFWMRWVRCFRLVPFSPELADSSFSSTRKNTTKNIWRKEFEKEEVAVNFAEVLIREEHQFSRNQVIEFQSDFNEQCIGQPEEYVGIRLSPWTTCTCRRQLDNLEVRPTRGVPWSPRPHPKNSQKISQPQVTATDPSKKWSRSPTGGRGISISGDKVHKHGH